MGEIEEGGCEETFLCKNPKIRKMQVHRATCSCSVELYKQWFTLADFLPNWDISRGFLYVCIIYIAGKIRAAVRAGYINFLASLVQWEITRGPIL